MAAFSAILAACGGASRESQEFRPPAANRSPTSVFSVSVTSGIVPLLDVEFNAPQSFDPDGSISDTQFRD